MSVWGEVVVVGERWVVSATIFAKYFGAPRVRVGPTF